MTENLIERTAFLGMNSLNIGTLNNGVLVSARTLRDLKAAPEDTEIEATEPVERTARVLQAPQLSSMPSNGDKQ